MGRIDLGSLARRAPISRNWGIERGGAIDRHYIEAFLARNAAAIRGRVLEIANDAYTRRFGTGVVHSDVLNVAEGVPGTTIVGDLARGDAIPSGAFDCVICTQTLQLVYPLEPAVKTLRRMLRPGGVLLATLPGVSQISRFDMDRWGDYWRFTRASARSTFERAFAPEELAIGCAGNALAATGFLLGLAAGELPRGALDHCDPRYELLVTVRAEAALRE
jgi:SAM-dependent methyltransferase